MKVNMEKELMNVLQHAEPKQLEKLLKKHALEERMQYEDVKPDKKAQERMIKTVLARTVASEKTEQKRGIFFPTSIQFWYGVICAVCVMVILVGGYMALRQRGSRELDVIGTTENDGHLNPSDDGVEVSSREDKETSSETIPETSSEDSKESESDDSIEMTSYGFGGYVGYLDECYRWDRYQEFMNLDYDADGLRDRVYKTNTSYQIEFGNGLILKIQGTKYSDYDWARPYIMAGDITGNGENEIVFFGNFSEATSNPMRGGYLRVFEKTKGSYEEIPSPTGVNEDGGWKVYLTCEEEEDQTLRFVCREIGLDFKDWFSESELQELSASDYIGGKCGGFPYDVRLEQEDETIKLVFSVAMLTKWFSNSLTVTVGYEDGYKVEKVNYMRDNGKEQTLELVEFPAFEMYADYDKADVKLEIYEDTTAKIVWNNQVLDFPEARIEPYNLGMYMTVQDLNRDGKNDILIRRIGVNDLDMYVVLIDEVDGIIQNQEWLVVPKGGDLVSKRWIEGTVDNASLHIIYNGEEVEEALSDQYLGVLRTRGGYFDEDGNLIEGAVERFEQQNDGYRVAGYTADRRQKIVEEDGNVYFISKQHFLTGIVYWSNVWIETKYCLNGNLFELIDTTFGSEDYNGW